MDEFEEDMKFEKEAHAKVSKAIGKKVKWWLNDR